ncbi:hypothetical protein [Nitrosomonas sp.]|nr:hypothetical protein [Nitrosomonas sp.]
MYKNTHITIDAASKVYHGYDVWNVRLSIAIGDINLAVSSG